ncbi:hypothetical protein RRG08_048211 [Elysia crispata]|uniref:Uncharacterized protein n=1 Tax=Elysia crispata TaxID=231223 RepID=A0AAE1CQ06_9GAST|nr:hypothetical protein RRG08_048211 [Elysia crispata]
MEPGTPSLGAATSSIFPAMRMRPASAQPHPCRITFNKRGATERALCTRRHKFRSLIKPECRALSHIKGFSLIPAG